MKFCTHCGSELEAKTLEGKERLRCRGCGSITYLNPKLAVAVIVNKGSRILLGKRGIPPGKGSWSFPSGYVDQGETVEDAALREVAEETGLKVALGKLVGLYSEHGDPVVLAVYCGDVIGGELGPGAEMLDVDYFPVDRLPPLAFQHDVRIIQDWLKSHAELPGSQG